MGKSKQKRHKARRPRPAGLPGEEVAELGMLCGEDEAATFILNLLDKLQSANTDSRECACTVIANLVTQPGAIPLLLQHNIIKILAPLMLDKSISVQNGAVGALRNMTVDGGAEVCNEMIKEDVMTPLIALIKQFTKFGGAQGYFKTRALSFRNSELFDATISKGHFVMLVMEGENIGVAVSIFNREKLIAVLLGHLRPEVYGYPLVLAVAQCLYTVTEDNIDANSYLDTAEQLSILQALISSSTDTMEKVLFQTLVAGILVNAVSKRVDSLNEHLVVRVIEIVANVLVFDATALAKSSMDEVSQVQSINGVGSSNHESKIMLSPEVSKELEEVENLILAQQIAMEIAANLCCPDDDEWEELDSNESGSCDELSTDIQMEEDTDGSEVFSPLCLPSEIHCAFVKNKILDKVLDKVQPIEFLADNVTSKQTRGQKIMKSLCQLHIHALLSLSNIISSLDHDALGGLDNLHGIWQTLSQLCTSRPAIQNLELLEGVTGAMRAIIQKLAELQSSKFSEVTLSDLKFLFDMTQHCQQNQIRVNAIHILSTIGGLLAKSDAAHPLLKVIGLSLAEIASTYQDLRVVAESLDAIFDVFGEDSVDSVLKEIELIEKLRNLSPVLKAKILSQKSKLGEHYPVIATARMNLDRFIKYKSQMLEKV